VIETHPLGSGYPLQQALDFGVINGLDLFGIVKVRDRSFVLCEHETVGVEREYWALGGRCGQQRFARCIFQTGDSGGVAHRHS
jgi:hypothetical protein